MQDFQVLYYVDVAISSLSYSLKSVVKWSLAKCETCTVTQIHVVLIQS